MNQTIKIFRDLLEFARVTPIPCVTFGPRISEVEAYAEPGMRASIVRALDGGDGVLKLTVNYEDFAGHNQTLESSNYYDKNGDPVLTAREAGAYAAVDDVFFMLDDLIDGFVAIESDESVSLYAEFKASGRSGGSLT